eukprot:NODE_3291_length_2059_cov_2.637681.p1 GENE.NODE_3291_length_2059_cov_2.637681~~NODE_3291_length_2059_cov_2.637681.p1  ORF type:complete len:643 (+),score=231.18 NODE_3291_length_2059_cov_2.637681:235-1929(+)
MQLACRYGAQMAAIAPFAGEYAAMWREEQREAVLQLRRLAIRAYHSGQDSHVSPKYCVDVMKWLGEQCGAAGVEEREVLVNDPDRPGRDATRHKMRLAVSAYDAGLKELWIVQGAGYHDCWPAVYHNEHIFGLFAWLLKQRCARPPMVCADFEFEAALEQPLHCCFRTDCPSASNGLCCARSALAAQLIVGTRTDAIEYTPLQEWNRRRRAGGERRRCVRVGDEVLVVNGNAASPERMLEELARPRRRFTLRLRRRYGLECDEAGLAACGLCGGFVDEGDWCDDCLAQYGGRRGRLRAAARANEAWEAARAAVWERHRRGEFGWGLRRSDASPEAGGDFEWRRRQWFASWWCLQCTCARMLDERFVELRARLREELPARLWPLLTHAEVSRAAGELPRAVWELAEAEATFDASRSLFALLMDDRIHDSIAGFAGEEMPVVHLPQSLNQSFTLLQELREAKSATLAPPPHTSLVEPDGRGGWTWKKQRRNRLDARRMCLRERDGLNPHTAVIRWQTPREAMRSLGYRGALSAARRRALAFADLAGALAHVRALPQPHREGELAAG